MSIDFLQSRVILEGLFKTNLIQHVSPFSSRIVTEANLYRDGILAEKSNFIMLDEFHHKTLPDNGESKVCSDSSFVPSLMN